MKKLYTLLLIGSMALAASAGVAKHKGVAHRAPSVPTPVVEPATNVTETGFTANWQAVPGAETYNLAVYAPVEVPNNGTYAVLEETFNLVAKGSFAEPYFPEDSWIDISGLGWTETPGWEGFWPLFAKGMVGGIIYSPYIDLTNNGGRFTVTFTVTGYSGGVVKLTSYGTDEKEVPFTLTTTGANTFSYTFENGIHDTFLKFVDFGIMDDPEGLYADCYDYLDEIVITQELKAGDLCLVPVAFAEPKRNSFDFKTLPFANDFKKLAYDVQANVVEFGDTEDIYDYEVYRSEYSDLMYVELSDGQGGGETPVDPPVNPGDPEYVGYINVGEFDNPGRNEITQGSGSWWERAPFQWYTIYSGSQMIYDTEYLNGMKDGDEITEIVFKYGDEGSFLDITADLHFFVENTEKHTFDKKPDLETYLWVDFDASSSQCQMDYEVELYYMEDEEIHFVLDRPLTYTGGPLLVTCWSTRTNDNEAQAVITYAMRTRQYATMSAGSDRISFEETYDTGVQADYQGPNKYLPVTKIYFNRVEKGVNSAVSETAQPEYFNLQGMRLTEAPESGLCIRRTGSKVDKIIIR